MSKPPRGYVPEPGATKQRCGHSWWRGLPVTGEIPGTDGFGADRRVTLPPIFNRDDLPATWGKKDEGEGELVSAVIGAVESTQEKLDLEEAWFTSVQRGSVEWVLQRALAELGAAEDLYEKWDLRQHGPFGLEFGDGLQNFPAAADISDCIVFSDEAQVPPKETHYGRLVPGRGRDEQLVMCPTRSELAQRQKDRDAIHVHLMDALWNVRCAQWGMYRTLLYKQALHDYKPELGVATATDPPIQRTPGMGLPDTLGVEGRPVDPPPGPRDAIMPDPKLLWRPDRQPPGGREVAVPVPDRSKVKRRNGTVTRSTSRTVVTLGVGLLGIWGLSKVL